MKGTELSEKDIAEIKKVEKELSKRIEDTKPVIKRKKRVPVPESEASKIARKVWRNTRFNRNSVANRHTRRKQGKERKSFGCIGESLTRQYH